MSGFWTLQAGSKMCQKKRPFKGRVRQLRPTVCFLIKKTHKVQFRFTSYNHRVFESLKKSGLQLVKRTQKKTSSLQVFGLIGQRPKTCTKGSKSATIGLFSQKMVQKPAQNIQIG